MAGKKAVKRWSVDEKAKALARLGQETASEVASALGVTDQTIYAWKKAAGMNGTKAAPASRPAKKAKKKAASKAANGHIQVTAGGLDTIEKQLETSLVSVRAMRVAFRTVFGGQ